MIFDVLTLFPEIIDSYCDVSIMKRAKESGVFEVNAINPRDFTLDRHKKVDDTPYGGGAGMVLAPQPYIDAYDSIEKLENSITVMLSPQGEPLNEMLVLDLSQKDQIIMLCGHYEGFDERIREIIKPKEISIGDFVLTGGELPALCLIDAVSRKLDGTLGKIESAEEVDYEKRAETESEIARVSDELEKIPESALHTTVQFEDIAKVIELWTGIPASKIQENDLKKLINLTEVLKSRIIGQDEAIDVISAAVRRSRVQINKKRRPASFIFVGPTGVGKTELVKVLANELFDTPETLIRLDMSEFMEKHSVSRIIGSPPGYVGYDEAGQLTEKVRRKPYSVILFDEIEKAHPDVLNILLQILDDGRVTDAHGRVVNFENTIIVMTSNAGSESKENSLGFGKTAETMVKDKAMKALEQILRPEFIGRVDEIVVFKPLEKESLAKIAALMLKDIEEPLNEKGMTLKYTKSVLDELAKETENKPRGARELRNSIRRKIEDVITNIIVEKFDNPPKEFDVKTSKGEIIVTAEQ